MNNSIFIFSIGIILSVFRLLCSESKELDTIMAIINIVAFDYVILIIFNEVGEVVKNLLYESSFTAKRQEILFRKVKVICFIVSLMLFCCISVLYVWKFRSSDWNDIISIMALVFSIISNSLSRKLGEIIYKFL